jgi:hypothetical protein
MNLVFESNLTATDISNGSITILDQATDSFRETQTPLYTNPDSGDGILQSNDRPPVAKDIDVFRNSTFYANTRSVHSSEFKFLSVSLLTSGQSKFIIGDGTTARTYTFRGATEVTDIKVDTFANMNDGGYFLLNSASNEQKYFIWFDKTGATAEPSGSDTTNRIPVQVDISADVTAANVAATLQGVIDGLDLFSASVLTDTVTITASKNGNVDDAADSVINPAGLISATVTTQGDGEDAAANDILLSSLLSPSQAIDESARSLVEIVNADSSSVVNAFYVSGEDDFPGAIRLEYKDLIDTEFYYGTQDDVVDITRQFSPQTYTATAIASMADQGGGLTRVTTSAVHGFTTADSVYIYDTTNAAFGKYAIQAIPSTTTFDITYTFDATTVGRVFNAAAASDNEISPNRLYFSKTSQPESVPLLNYIDIGGKDSEIKRIIALRDNLFALKEDGVYIVTGGAGSFDSNLLDASANIIAPDSATVLNDKIYMLSTQGVATISDVGVSIISRVIEDKILDITRPGFDYATDSFGVGYESDRSYIIWLPEKTTDTVATQAYRYNTFNGTWVRWIKDATSAVVNPKDDKLYVGSGDSLYTLKERKNLDRTDYADGDQPGSIPVQTISDDTLLTLASVSDIKIGDVLTQSPYLTIAKFNRILRKLDLDAGLDSDYLSILEATIGDDMVVNLAALVAKVDADDTSVSYTTPAGTTFEQVKDDYNAFVGEINTSTQTQFHNYSTITDATELEVIVIGIDSQISAVNLAYSMPLIAGPITIYSKIDSEIEWAVNHFGDPSAVKQVSAATIIFDGNNFYSASIGFSTDLSKAFIDNEFLSRGVGFWGGDDWGNSAFGGNGTDIPHRTIVPREKQRCRYISARFLHNNAREEFKIVGISLSARMISDRGYRDL